MSTLSALIIDEKEDFRVSLELLVERERERASQRGAARVHIGRVAQTTGPARRPDPSTARDCRDAKPF